MFEDLLISVFRGVGSFVKGGCKCYYIIRKRERVLVYIGWINYFLLPQNQINIDS